MAFEQWIIAEIMGHDRVSGHATEEQVAGQTFLRVDIPKTTYAEAFTKYFGAASIFSITVTDEKTATLAAEALKARPVNPFIIQLPTNPLLAEKVKQPYEDMVLAMEASDEHLYDDDEDSYEPDDDYDDGRDYDDDNAF